MAKPTIQFHVRPLRANHTIASFDTVEEAQQYIDDRRRYDPTLDKLVPMHRLIRHVTNEYEIVQVAA